jgi:nucleotide-binding universal stress UspA family protein
MYRDILLAIDLGEDASWKNALPAAIDLAKASGGVLHVMTVIPDFGMSIVGAFFPDDFEAKALEKAREHLHAFTADHIPSDIKVQHIIQHGRPADEILEMAEKLPTDIIVMGSHRPGVDHMLIGSTALRVVSRATCSVLVVRS